MDYYTILGLDPHCSDEEIEARYKMLAKRYANHQAHENVAQKLLEVNEAYSILGNPESRQEYDYHHMVNEVHKPHRHHRGIPHKPASYLFSKGGPMHTSKNVHQLIKRIVIFLVLINMVTLIYFIFQFAANVTHSESLGLLIGEYLGGFLMVSLAIVVCSAALVLNKYTAV